MKNIDEMIKRREAVESAIKSLEKDILGNSIIWKL